MSHPIWGMLPFCPICVSFSPKAISRVVHQGLAQRNRQGFLPWTVARDDRFCMQFSHSQSSDNKFSHSQSSDNKFSISHLSDQQFSHSTFSHNHCSHSQNSDSESAAS